LRILRWVGVENCRFGTVVLRREGEDLIRRDLEDASEQQREGERRDIAIALNRINALAGYAGAGSKVFLSPVTGLAEFADAVLDSRIQVSKPTRVQWKANLAEQ
jgi:hypothetical protein